MNEKEPKPEVELQKGELDTSVERQPDDFSRRAKEGTNYLEDMLNRLEQDLASVEDVEIDEQLRKDLFALLGRRVLRRTTYRKARDILIKLSQKK